jgi:hypothetical protein
LPHPSRSAICCTAAIGSPIEAASIVGPLGISFIARDGYGRFAYGLSTNRRNGDANVSNEMLQDVAKAIAEAISKGKDPARAALSAMRRPTREMIAAGLFSMDHGPRGHAREDANLEAAYEGMIDNALGYASRSRQDLADAESDSIIARLKFAQ